MRDHAQAVGRPWTECLAVCTTLCVLVRAGECTVLVAVASACAKWTGAAASAERKRREPARVILRE
jgi:hypothetical protein